MLSASALSSVRSMPEIAVGDTDEKWTPLHSMPRVGAWRDSTSTADSPETLGNSKEACGGTAVNHPAVTKRSHHLS